MTTDAPSHKLTKKDFQSAMAVRWCPGCGDYAILNAIQSVLPQFGIPREKFVIVSGIGCSSRFPYYMNTYGFHGIHGRAPTLATGIKLANPELDVWVITGDGDGLSIGGNHTMHALRRNVGVKIVLFNNRIYGLTKGQTSPTSEHGKRTKSTPMGNVDNPVNPLGLALGAEATFVANVADVFSKEMQRILIAAHEHPGSAFVQIYQNCVIFNNGSFKHFTEKDRRADRCLMLEKGKPMVFGKNRDKGLMWRGHELRVVDLEKDKIHVDQLAVHDPEEPLPNQAWALAKLEEIPGTPVPIGIIRNIQKPVYETETHRQIEEAQVKGGVGTIEDLLNRGDIWTVK